MKEKCMISKWINRDIWNFFIATLKSRFGSNYGITNTHIERALYYYAKNMKEGKLNQIGIKEKVAGHRLSLEIEDITIHTKVKPARRATVFTSDIPKDDKHEE